jgi:AcrR family transcriptional regulator
MAQVPKTRVREGFVRAAAQSFSELGFAATTMAAVAARADSSVGNLYKYFANKDELFDAVVPARLARELRERTRERIRALGSSRDVRELPGESPYHVLAGELLDFSLQHREAVVILLARAEGTAFANFAREFVAELVAWALEYAKTAYPALAPSPELGFVLTRVYENFLSSIAAALLRFHDENRVRRVIFQLTSHHQGGLKRLFESEGGIDAADSRHLSESPVVSTAAGPSARYSGVGATHSGLVRPSAGRADRARGTRRRR